MAEEKPPEEPKQEEVAVEEVVEEEKIEAAPSEAVALEEVPAEEDLEAVKDNAPDWTPKTGLGKKVKSGEITNVDDILDKGLKILEPEIIDVLLPDVQTDLLLIGQSKGKFGGGQRRVFKQVQKKTKEGNKPQFVTMAVVGNENGYVGIGRGKSKETVPAREKAFVKAKMNIIKIRRGCGDWHCGCGESHTVPFAVTGKCGSSTIKLIPAPKGTGLCVEKECAKILKLAGFKDVWAKSFGQTKTKINLVKACMQALGKLNTTKVIPVYNEQLSIAEGAIAKPVEAVEEAEVENE